VAPLAKLSGLAVAGFVVATMVGLAVRRRDARLFWRVGVPVTFATAAFSGWWYLRNLVLYGEPTGISRMLPGNMRRDFDWLPWLAGLPAELVGLWRSYWGLFGWFTLPMPGWAYAAIDLAVLAALVGLALAAVRRAPFVRWGIVAWLGVWLVVVFGSLLRWMTIAKGAQGRLLYPAIAAVAVLLVAGLRGLLPASVTDRAIAWGAGVSLAVLSVLALMGVVRPAYALPSALDRVPQGAERVAAVWSNFLYLDAVEVPERVGLGEDVLATLYWRAAPGATMVVDPPGRALPGDDRDAFVATRLDRMPASPGDGGPAVAESGPVGLTYPGSGTLPPSLMETGKVYADRRRIAPPAQDPTVEQPWVERLSVHLYGPRSGGADDPETGPEMYRWPLRGSDTGEWFTFVVREPQRRARLPDRPPDARFAGGIELWIERAGGSAELPDPATSGSEEPAAGQNAFVPIWAATEDLSTDLSAFVHFLASEADVVGQEDGPPSNRAYFPTRFWRAGDVVTGRPISAPPMASSLRMGLYDAATGTRLPAFLASGDALPDNALVVPLETAP
jgi:hypothetical protein